MGRGDEDGELQQFFLAAGDDDGAVAPGSDADDVGENVIHPAGGGVEVGVRGVDGEAEARHPRGAAAGRAVLAERFQPAPEARVVDEEEIRPCLCGQFLRGEAGVQGKGDFPDWLLRVAVVQADWIAGGGEAEGGGFLDGGDDFRERGDGGGGGGLGGHRRSPAC